MPQNAAEKLAQRMQKLATLAMETPYPHEAYNALDKLRALHANSVDLAPSGQTAPPAVKIPSKPLRPVNLVAANASHVFDQEHVFDVSVRHLIAANCVVGTLRAQDCGGRSCLHQTDFGGWKRQPEECLEFFLRDVFDNIFGSFFAANPEGVRKRTELRRALKVVRRTKAKHVVVFVDRYPEKLWRIWWQSRLFSWRGIRLFVLQIGDRHTHRRLKYLARVTGGQYRWLPQGKHAEMAMPALLEFIR